MDVAKIPGTDFFRRRSAPVTVGTLIAIALSYAAGLVAPVLMFLFSFAYPGHYWWGLLTYPLAVGYIDPFGLILAGIWFYLAGSDLEHRWGSAHFGLAAALAVPASSLPLALGSFVMGRPVELAGFALPLACVTVLWCLANPDGVILFGLLLPIPVKIFLVLEFLLVYLYAARSFGLILGLFALGGPALAYLYAARSGPGGKWRAAVRYSRRKHRRPEELRRRRRRGY